MKALRELKANDRIVISKPDKGKAVVVMKKSDYVSKMLVILNDETKFQTLGPVDTHDKTPSVEVSLNNFLNQLNMNKLFMKALTAV